MIAALAVQRQSSYIYLRGDNIATCRKRPSHLRAPGKNIFRSASDLDIFTHSGAGAYEVGEESAPLESLEGKRGIRRSRTAVSGGRVWGGADGDQR